jgi:hypothetical protein
MRIKFSAPEQANDTTAPLASAAQAASWVAADNACRRAAAGAI